MTPSDNTNPRGMPQILALSPVIPVLAIADPDTAVPLARALGQGGLRVIEVTLRTPCALRAIQSIAAEVEDVIVGAGTVLSREDLDKVQEAGAAFAVSPGSTVSLLQAAKQQALPLLPGVATAAEVMAAMEQGYSCLKFFPAEAAGGVSMLKALAGPFPTISFCPTGGIREENLASYLALGNVSAVGGTWLAPGDAVEAGHWGRIQALAARALALSRN